jgi:hypothetical protein
MTDAEMLRRVPFRIEIRFYPLHDGMKLEVQTKIYPGRESTLYEGAFAGVDGSAETARKALEQFVEDVKSALENEAEEEIARRK